MEKTYKTSQVARVVGLHPNTIRFYEAIGFLTPPRRAANGYRVYTELQLAQCRLARVAMGTETLQSGLRKRALEILRLCARLDFDGALAKAQAYAKTVGEEQSRARAAAVLAQRSLQGPGAAEAPAPDRPAAAQRLGISVETLRGWERNGLTESVAGPGGRRGYTPKAMERLQLVRALRVAMYSHTAILRLLSRFDQGADAVRLLNTPAPDEDVVSVCDRLLLSLEATAADAAHLLEMLAEMKMKFQQKSETLQ